MNPTELAMLEALRRTLEGTPGLRQARLARPEERVEVPLSRLPAAVLEPGEAEDLAWPGVAAGTYRLRHWQARILDRALPGSRVFEALLAIAEAARSAIAAGASLGGLASDGPASALRGDLAPLVGATRTGPLEVSSAAPGEPTAVVFRGASGSWSAWPTGLAAIDDELLFSTGPHVLSIGSPERRVKDQPFNGLAGGLALDLGEGPREIVQDGVLSAATAEGLALSEAAIESFIDGRLYTLTDRDGADYPHCRMERFQRLGPPQTGLQWHQTYRITYRQLAR
jgi:hypothetical protein